MPDPRANFAVFQAHLFHENDNLSQRLFWYLFSQSLLFGAYSGVLNAPEKAKSPLFASQQELIVLVLPVTALLISALLYPMIIVSVRHMSGLRKQFEAQIGPDRLADLPPIHGNPTLRRVGDFGYLGMPVILTGAWIVLLIGIISRTVAT